MVSVEKNMKSGLLSGLKWTGLSTIIVNISKLLQIAILTRFLSKEEFGIVAIAMLCIGFINVLLDMGLSTAILHKQDISKKHYSSLFWLNVFVGFFLSAILFSCANLIADFYDEKQLVTIIQLLSLNIFLASLGQQHRVQRQKQLDFKALGVIESISALLALVVVFVLALLNYGIYSLIIATLVNVASLNILLLLYGVYKDNNISFYFNFDDTKPYLKIGLYQLAAGLLDFFARELDIFIISIILGKEILGVYSLCKQLPTALYQLFNTIINKVATPMFAKAQDDIDYVKDSFIRLSGVVAIVSFPMFFLIGLLSPVLLKYLYGNSYIEYYWVLTTMILAFSFLSIAGIFSSVSVAYGRTDIGFYWTIYRVISSAFFIYVGTQFGLEGLVIAFFANFFINATFPFWYVQVRSILGLRLLEYLSPQILPFLISTFVFVILRYFYTDFNVVMSLLFSMIFILLYVIIIYKLKKDSYEVNILRTNFQYFLKKIGFRF